MQNETETPPQGVTIKETIDGVAVETIETAAPRARKARQDAARPKPDRKSVV